MLFRSIAEVTIPAHKLSQFKSAMLRHAPSEHRAVNAELGHISAFPIRREGAHAVVRVLIDAEVWLEDLGDFAEQWETDDARSAADETVTFAVIRVGGERDYTLNTVRAE